MWKSASSALLEEVMPRITLHGTEVLITVIDGFFRWKFRNDDAAARAVELLHQKLTGDSEAARIVRTDCNKQNMERFLDQFFGD